VNNIECRYKPYIKMHKFLTENGEKLKGKFYSDYGENPDTKINIFNHTITFSLFTRFLFTFSLLSQIRNQKINIMNLATKNKIIKTKGNEKGIQKEIGGHRRTFLREF